MAQPPGGLHDPGSPVKEDYLGNLMHYQLIEFCVTGFRCSFIPDFIAVFPINFKDWVVFYGFYESVFLRSMSLSFFVNMGKVWVGSWIDPQYGFRSISVFAGREFDRQIFLR